MKRKTVSMIVRVTVPADKSAAWARNEVRHLIKDGVGYFCNAGDDDGAKVRAVLPAGRGCK